MMIGLKMPIYTFRNEKTQNVFDQYMTYNEKLEYLVKNPHIKSLIRGTPSFVPIDKLEATKGRPRTPDGWTDVMKKIQKRTGTNFSYRD